MAAKTKTKAKAKPKKKLENEEIRTSVKKIREECDNIEDEIEPKEVQTRGDPVVRIR